MNEKVKAETKELFKNKKITRTKVNTKFHKALFCLFFTERRMLESLKEIANEGTVSLFLLN